jgi:hypothetical protein
VYGPDVMNRATRVPLTGRWLVQDRADLVVSVLVLVLGTTALLRDHPSRWLILVIVGLVWVGIPNRWMVNRHRRKLAELD